MTDRPGGALWGLFIGDALAMPVHWYYDRAALRRDYGEVRDYLTPTNPHPDSILWRARYDPPDPEADILHDQAAYWGRRGVHYHQFLRAGENTLNLQLVRLLLEHVHETGAYDPDAYLERMVAFLRTPGRHRDTYAEEWLRGFFTNRARGRDLREAIDAVVERARNSLLQRPFARWERLDDLEVIGRELSPACYVDQAIPAVVHLARRHHDDPETALVANTMAGGDNCYRGVVLGALLGAAHGTEGWPARWREGLLAPPPQDGPGFA